MNCKKAFEITPGVKVRLKDIDPSQKGGYDGKQDALPDLQKNIEKLKELQYNLYAEDKRSLLIVLQGIDAAGKDGTTRHVMGGLNPQGCQVTSFKVPSSEERDHDYLWRIHKACPRRGEIGIFNRSHYEDVLVVRVHDFVPKSVWSERYDQINRFEKNLAECGTTILKFFLYISPEEQKERFQARIDDPRKRWKFSPDDVEKRKFWDDYIEAFEDMLEKCSTKHAPWYVIPSNRKWFRNLAVSEIIVKTIKDMNPIIPQPAEDYSQFKID